MVRINRSHHHQLQSKALDLFKQNELERFFGSMKEHIISMKKIKESAAKEAGTSFNSWKKSLLAPNKYGFREDKMRNNLE